MLELLEIKGMAEDLKRHSLAQEIERILAEDGQALPDHLRFPIPFNVNGHRISKSIINDFRYTMGLWEAVLPLGYQDTDGPELPEKTLHSIGYQLLYVDQKGQSIEKYLKNNQTRERSFAEVAVMPKRVFQFINREGKLYPGKERYDLMCRSTAELLALTLNDLQERLTNAGVMGISQKLEEISKIARESVYPEKLIRFYGKRTGA
jgi:hypothetical protein